MDLVPVSADHTERPVLYGAVVVGTLWVGAIVAGYVFDALLAGRLF